MTKRKTSYKRSTSTKSRKDSNIEDIPEIITSRNMDRSFKINAKYNLTPVHKSFTELCYSAKTNIAFVDGPAGTAKTYCAALIALNMLKSHRVDEVVYIYGFVRNRGVCQPLRCRYSQG